MSYSGGDMNEEQIRAYANGLHEENKRLEGEKKRLKGENERIKGENERLRGVDDENKRLRGVDDENERIKGENERLKADKLAKSVVGVLYPNEMPLVCCDGTKSSHLNPPKQPPEFTHERLFVCHQVSSMDNFNQFEMHELSSSFLLKKVRADNKFSNESDLQVIVGSAVDDAVAICNKIIAVTATNRQQLPLNLTSRTESNIFSNIIDHVVVYDSLANAPLFAVETKKHLHGSDMTPEGIRKSRKKVFGQCYDQLRAMRLMGNPCPFGALTSCVDTIVTRLDEDSSNDVITDHNSRGLNHDRLLKINERLPVSVTSSHSQSPPRMISSDDSSEATANTELNSTSPLDPEISPIPRTLIISEVFEQNKFVDVLVNGILCSLSGTYRQYELAVWNEGTIVECNNSIRVTQDSYEWCNFTKMTHKGPLTKELFANSENQDLFLTDYLGHGATSKVYRAITSSGFSCVVKMYVLRRLDDNTIPKTPQFLANSKKLADKEAANIHEIYNDSLQEFVWRQTLNNLHCVIMPFFEPIPKAERSDSLEGVKTTLGMFATARKLYKKTDQTWRHAGTFNKKVYLFDLGDLVDVSSKSVDFIDAEINKHVDFLKERAVDRSHPNSNSPLEAVV